jgi:hypothetical protein
MRPTKHWCNHCSATQAQVAARTRCLMYNMCLNNEPEDASKRHLLSTPPPAKPACNQATAQNNQSTTTTCRYKSCQPAESPSSLHKPQQTYNIQHRVRYVWSLSPPCLQTLSFFLAQLCSAELPESLSLPANPPNPSRLQQRATGVCVSTRAADLLLLLAASVAALLPGCSQACRERHVGGRALLGGPRASGGQLGNPPVRWQLKPGNRARATWHQEMVARSHRHTWHSGACMAGHDTCWACGITDGHGTHRTCWHRGTCMS